MEAFKQSSSLAVIQMEAAERLFESANTVADSGVIVKREKLSPIRIVSIYASSPLQNVISLTRFSFYLHRCYSFAVRVHSRNESGLGTVISRWWSGVRKRQDRRGDPYQRADRQQC